MHAKLGFKFARARQGIHVPYLVFLHSWEYQVPIPVWGAVVATRTLASLLPVSSTRSHFHPRLRLQAANSIWLDIIENQTRLGIETNGSLIWPETMPDTHTSNIGSRILNYADDIISCQETSELSCCWSGKMNDKSVNVLLWNLPLDESVGERCQSSPPRLRIVNYVRNTSWLCMYLVCSLFETAHRYDES